MPRIAPYFSHTTKKFGVVVPKEGYGQEVAGLTADAMTMTLGKVYESYLCPHCGAWHVGTKPSRPKVKPFHPQSELILLELGGRVMNALGPENARLSGGAARRKRTIMNRVYLARWKAAKRDLSDDEFERYVREQQSPNKTPKKGTRTGSR